MPIEMHHHIIDSLENETDSRTIAHCALVCRAWLPFSRSKLYRRIDLRSRLQWNRFKDHIVRPASHMTPYLEKVREMCVSRQDPCAGLFCMWRRPRGLFRRSTDSEWPWIHTVLDLCVVQLSGLPKFTFVQIDWTRPGFHKNAIDSCGLYHSLTSLRLERCTFLDILQLQQLVLAFPALSDLALSHILFHDSSTLR